MIHFFRKIRRNLLANSQFLKYLKYAIGEIILVVLGILIALYINNWNENRKSEEKAKLLITQVQKELLYNIERTNYAIYNYVDKDSLFYRVIKQNVTYKDYEFSNPLSKLITNFETEGNFRDNAYKQLVENEKGFTPEQDSIVKQLKNLYELDLFKVKTRNKVIKEMVSNFRQKLKDEKPWYSELETQSSASHIEPVLSKEIISYFLNDPYYLNDVQEFIKFGYKDHLKSVLGFRIRAISINDEISDYLNQPPGPIIAYNIDDFSDFIGYYENEKITLSKDEESVRVVIGRENDRLWLTIYKNDSFFWKYPVHPYSKNSYIAGYEIKNEWEGVLNKFIHNEETGKVELILIGDYGPTNQKRPKYIKID